MIRARWLTPRRIAPLLIAALVGLLVGLGLGREGDQGHEHEAAAEATIWTCSMHPQVRQPDPGDCPLCGMALIPLEDDHLGGDDGPPQLELGERAAALLSVEVWPVERLGSREGLVKGHRELSGIVAVDETLVDDLAIRTEGQVSRLHVRHENAPVKKGQAIAEIHSPAVHRASLELLRLAGASGEGTEELADAAKRQLRSLGVDAAQVDQVVEKGEPLATYTLKSPRSGVLLSLDARQGNWLASGGRLGQVAGLERLWVDMEAYERDLALVAVGDSLEFEVEAFPGEAFSGAVTFVDPLLDPDRRTARVRVVADNAAGRLKPGMLVRGRVLEAVADDPLVVPHTAPLRTGRRALVYVKLPDRERPTFEAREVTLGARHGHLQEITAGLEEGDLVVVDGAFRIDSELQLRGRPGMMSPEAWAEPPPTHSLPDDAAARLDEVLAAYLEVTFALSRDDEAGAKAGAARLRDLLEQDGLQLTGEAAALWREARHEMLDAASRMVAAPDIKEVRRALPPLSDRLEEVVIALPSPVFGPLYRATCPMVEGKEESWLTREPVVENPYWGAEMFGCGEVKDKVSD